MVNTEKLQKISGKKSENMKNHEKQCGCQIVLE